MNNKFWTPGTVFAAGIAGGTVEVAWVMFFCMMSPLQASLVAEEISRSFLPQIAGFPAVATGLIIHFALSVLIAGVFAFAVSRLLKDRIGLPSVLAVAGVALAAIWAMNFFVILPIVNPEFVALMPYTVTLVSKLGFGIAMGWVFGAHTAASTRHVAHRRFATH